MKALDPQNQKSLKTISFLTNWMDTKFRIPGTDIKFGVDALLSLIPGLGDILSTGISLSIFSLILGKGVPFGTALKMMFNIIFDAILSSVPLLGSIADVAFKANTRNLKLLEHHLQENPEGKYKYGVWMVFALTLAILTAIFILLLFGLWQLVGVLIAA
jgi:hypothetical protein